MVAPMSESSSGQGHGKGQALSQRLRRYGAGAEYAGLTALGLLVPLLAGCDGGIGGVITGDVDLPHENGVEHGCFFEIPNYGADDAVLCANLGTDPQLLEAACLDECGDWAGNSFNIGRAGGLCVWPIGCIAIPDCVVQDITLLNTPCSSSPPHGLQGGPADYVATLIAGSQAAVTLAGDQETAGAHGTLSYYLRPDPRFEACPGGVCRLEITDLRLTLDNFTVNPFVCNANVKNVRVAIDDHLIGQWNQNTKQFTIPSAGNGRIRTAFTVERCTEASFCISCPDSSGSNTLAGDDNLSGTLDPTAGTLTINSVLEQDDVRVELALSAVNTQGPPDALISPNPGVFECTSPAGRTVTVSGSLSTDPDGDITSYLWSLDNVDGPPDFVGATFDRVFPLGTSTVGLAVLDSRLGLDVATGTVTIQDTVPPVLSTPATQTVVGCAVGGVATIPLPEVQDVCTIREDIEVVGSVIATTVPNLPTPIPLTSDGEAVLPPGIHTVRWTATDPSNNSDFIDTQVTIESCWPMFGRLANHTGQSPFVGPATNAVLFSFEVNRDVKSSPAVATDGTVYFGSDDNRVYAVNPDGTLKWSRATNGDVQSSPAIGVGGIVYVGSDDDRLYALDPDDGTVICSRSLGGLDVESSPTIGVDGTVYVGAEDNRLYALNPNTCAINWSVLTGGDVDSSAAVGPNGDIYFGSDDERVYARHPDGSAKWTFETNGDVNSSPALSNDGSVVYVGSDDNRIRALSAATGALVWSRTVGGDVRTRPSVAATGTVYVGSEDGNIYALNPADGTILWSRKLGIDVTSSAAIGADGTVYVGADSDRVYALDGTTGATIWSFETGADVKSSPAIGLNGVLYVGSEDDRLYAFGASQTLGVRAEAEPIQSPAEPTAVAPAGGGCACAVSGPSSARAGLSLLGTMLLVLGGFARRRVRSRVRE